MKTKQAVNPYMPSWEYVPDAEPHVEETVCMFTVLMTYSTD